MPETHPHPTECDTCGEPTAGAMYCSTECTPIVCTKCGGGYGTANSDGECDECGPVDCCDGVAAIVDDDIECRIWCTGCERSLGREYADQAIRAWNDEVRDDAELSAIVLDSIKERKAA